MQAERGYGQLEQRQLPKAWRDAVLAERWLRDPSNSPANSVLTCLRAEKKPYLDGVLDEAIWQAAQPAPLRSQLGDDAHWPANLIVCL